MDNGANFADPRLKNDGFSMVPPNIKFSDIDTDQDGVISRPEFYKFFGPSATNITSATSGMNTTGLDNETTRIAAGYTASSNPTWSQYGNDVRGRGLYFASPPTINLVPSNLRENVQQKVTVKFLRPPPIPPQGPLIIEEVRPPQPPPPPPLRVSQRQQPTKLPPIVLRERPPQPPLVQGPQRFVHALPALPVPPRSVIIDRFPAAPTPRDIIIERWLPYMNNGGRKVLFNRAPMPERTPRPVYIINQHEPPKVQTIRDFKRLDITDENPQAYVQRYGPQLLDAATLVQQARAAGVIEDISVPGTGREASPEPPIITTFLKLVQQAGGNASAIPDSMWSAIKRFATDGANVQSSAGNFSSAADSGTFGEVFATDAFNAADADRDVRFDASQSFQGGL